MLFKVYESGYVALLVVSGSIGKPLKVFFNWLWQYLLFSINSIFSIGFSTDQKSGVTHMAFIVIH